MSELNPEGPPEVLQMFVRGRNQMTMMPEYALAFGFHRDWPGGYGAIANGVAGPGQKIRIVIDELLRGSELEMFQCACDDPNASPAPNCGGDDARYAIDERTCPENPDTTALEEGRWLDVNIDGVPDNAVMLPGIVSIVCDNGTWTNGLNDGWYNPSGNQFPGAGSPQPFEYLGPAIVVVPTLLPTSSTCAVEIADSVVSKDGENIVLPTGAAGVTEEGAAVMYGDALTFSTEAMLAITSSPAAEAMDADLMISPTVTLNVPVDDTTVTAATVTLETAGGVAVPGTVMVGGSGADIIFDPTAPLDPNTEYVLTIETGVTDTYGVAAPGPITITFTTGM